MEADVRLERRDARRHARHPACSSEHGAAAKASLSAFYQACELVLALKGLSRGDLACWGHSYE